jgi:phosphinothricin tripeptide acetyl hydrolase
MASKELDAVLELLRKHPFQLDAGEEELRRGLDRLGKAFAPPDGVKRDLLTIGGVPAERLSAGDGPSVLFLHGGGYVVGSPQSHRHLGGLLAKELGGTVWVLDYRRAPEFPFPAAVDDAVAAYRDLAAQVSPRRPAIVGDSAGGGLTFALALRSRDEGLPTPMALVGIGPWVNLGTESETYDLYKSLDPLTSREIAAYFAKRYLSGAPSSEPLASPLFADLEGLPPTLIQVGDRECFLGDAVRMHQRLIVAGVDSELSVWKEMFHVWHLYWPMLPEGKRAVAEIARFLAARK